MEFSNLILTRSKNPKFLGINIQSSGIEFNTTVSLVKLATTVTMNWTTVEISGEICIKEISYLTKLEGPFLGILDAFIELSINRPVEAIDRFPAKELEYFLRDKPSRASIPGLGNEFYELLSLGESLKKITFNLETEVCVYNTKTNGPFDEISVSEQYDFMEEFFSEVLLEKYPSIIFDVEDIDGFQVFLSYRGGRLSANDLLEIAGLGSHVFGERLEFKFS